MTNSVILALHLLSAVIWVGGMFFAYMALRPAAAQVLEPPLRLELWIQVFRRFFLWVWLSIFILMATGYWMLFNVFRGFANAGMHIHIMHGAGIIMVLIYLHVFFAPYRRLRHAVVVQDYPEGARQLAVIRKLIALNLTIGLVVVVVAGGEAARLADVQFHAGLVEHRPREIGVALADQRRYGRVEFDRVDRSRTVQAGPQNVGADL